MTSHIFSGEILHVLLAHEVCTTHSPWKKHISPWTERMTVFLYTKQLVKSRRDEAPFHHEPTDDPLSMVSKGMIIRFKGMRLPYRFATRC